MCLALPCDPGGSSVFPILWWMLGMWRSSKPDPLLNPVGGLSRHRFRRRLVGLDIARSSDDDLETEGRPETGLLKRPLRESILKALKP